MTIYSLSYSFPDLEPVCCSMSSSNCFFLTCIQISQETDLLKNFPQFVVVHRVKGFGIVNKFRSRHFFWNSLASSMIQQMLDHRIWSLVPVPFLNPAWTSKSSQFMYCWSLTWRILSITLLMCEMSTIVQLFQHSLGLPFFGIGMKTGLFYSCSHCWVFQICWHFECSTFTAPSFRTWNSSARIPSPPLSLFIVMLPKAHLTSHSRVSGSRWVITASWSQKKKTTGQYH